MVEYVTLPIDAIAFEDICVRTGEPSETTITVEIEHGVDLVLVSFKRALAVDLPVCARVKRRHAVMFWSWSLFALAVTVLLICVAALTSEDDPVWVVVPVLLALWWGRNRFPQLVDRVTLGVWGRSFSERDGTLTLGFTDPRVAERARRCAGRPAAQRPHTRVDV